MSDTTKPKRVHRWINEFREFATQGNVIDLAVGVIIGGAFGKISASLVSDIFMPIISKIVGEKSFSEWQIVLTAVMGPDNTLTDESIIIHIGSFISTIVDFLLIAFCVFLFVKLINTLRRKKAAESEAPAAPAEPAPPSPDIALLTEIRDLLERQKTDKGK